MAKIAVDAATYAIDMPYDYLIPNELEDKVQVGVRVMVPFSRGNRQVEGIVLALRDHADYDKLKSITSVLDDEPLLSKEAVKLALWMHERYFCTVFDAIRAMLPAGLWFNGDGKRKVNDKTLSYASLAVPAEDAAMIMAAKKKKRTVTICCFGVPLQLRRRYRQ